MIGKRGNTRTHGNRPGYLSSARNRTSFLEWTFPVRAYYLQIDSSSLWHAASSTSESAEWSEWSAISLRIAKREIYERTAHGNRSGHLSSARNRTSFPGWTYPVRAYYLKIDSSSLWHAASSTTESAEWSEWSAISLRIAKREIYERIAHGNRPGHLLSARNRTSFPGWTYPVRAYYLKIDSSLWHAASSTTESAEWSEWSAISLRIAKGKYTNARHTATDLGIYRAPGIGPRSRDELTP